ncbi:MAG TPA: DUF1329 domain-containing protein [Acetobacteraceae bacterium]|nr:DUF1329 domain-containing protein [Acetobacteraceae bacterium]
MGSCPAQGQSAQDLGKSLTPLGAIRAGNADGTIPAWTGGIRTSPAGWHEGMPRPNPFAGEKPLFTITAQNVQRYESKLSVGTAAMIKTLQGFHVNVYPTHRTAAQPQYIYDATIANATRAHLINGGQDVEGAQVGIPFPIAHNGNEAIWNHILRWRGQEIVRNVDTAITTPSGDYTVQRWLEKIYLPYNIPGLSNPQKWDSMYWNEVTAPPRIAGLITMAISYQDPYQRPRGAWQYYPGERRVRRAPEISYDTPYNNTDGLATVDDYDMFNGAIDRYDWKLVGRKEIYVPYNTARFQDPHLHLSDLLRRDSINPDVIRWELHRVWVVDATLKPDFMHIYSRRTLYIDEDSWMALISDRYDGRGLLWRCGLAMGVQMPDVPGFLEDGHVYTDLYQHRYLVAGMHNQTRPPVYAGINLSPRDYTAEALRRFGRR